ncbi:MAG: serine hydrolase [Lacipirellulaceae bacterium]
MPQSLSELVAATLDGVPLRVGVAVTRIDTGEAFAVRADEVFTQASAIKIPILWELETRAARGELSLDETMSPADVPDVAGCGVVRYLTSPATRLSLGDIGVLMTVLSDNVATNLLIQRLGFEAINALCDRRAGPQTRLRRWMVDLEARAKGIENTSTPAEAVRLMTTLARHEAEGDVAAKRAMATLRLPKESPLFAELSAIRGVAVANKPGFLDGLRTEWAVVTGPRRNYALALMIDGAEPNDAGDTLMKQTIRDIARAVDEVMAS